MSAADIEIVGEGIDGLRRAAKLSHAGARVAYVERGLRAGAPFLTESFLTPFRFNLGPSLVRRAAVAGAHVLEPDPILAIGAAMLGRSPVRVGRGPTVWDAVHAEPAERRLLLAGLALLLSIDPDAEGSGERLRRAAADLDDLVLVAGGNGLVAAALIDQIVAAGGGVQEGAGGPLPLPVRAADELGVCRMFVGLRSATPPAGAFATAVGFEDERSLRERLDGLRAGSDSRPLGFVLSNAHLDPQRPGDPLSSVVWQGVLSAVSRPRDEVARETLAAAGIDERDVIFQLLWLPDETGERLRR